MSQHSDSESTSFSKLKVDLVKDLVVDTLLSGFDDTDWDIVHEQLQRQPQIKHIDTSPEPPGGTSRNIIDFEWFSWIITRVIHNRSTSVAGGLSNWRDPCRSNALANRSLNFWTNQADGCVLKWAYSLKMNHWILGYPTFRFHPDVMKNGNPAPKNVGLQTLCKSLYPTN